MNDHMDASLFDWGPPVYWHRGIGSPRGKVTPPSEDGMVLCPSRDGEFMNGMYASVTQEGDGRTLYGITWLNPHTEPWGWYDPNPFPPLIVAPRMHSLAAHVRWLRAKPGRALHRVVDAWNVLRGKAYVDDGSGW